jgi:predicted neutral ceramidase superfamily lipid hydrolase
LNYTDEQIKSIGSKRFFKKNKVRLLIQFVMCVAWVVIIVVMKPTIKAGDTDIKALIMAAPFVLVIANVLISYSKSQKNFIAKVRANPEILE